MKIKVAEATDAVLDLLVSRSDNPDGRDGWGWFERDEEGFLFDPLNECRYSPSTDWSQGGPIIEREGIGFYKANSTKWWAHPYGGEYNAEGTTSLIAAMRCYVSSKLGDVVDIPEELM